MQKLLFKLGTMAALSFSMLQACGDDETFESSKCIPDQTVVCGCPSGLASKGKTYCVANDSTQYVDCECDPSASSVTTVVASSSSTGGVQCLPEETDCKGQCVDLSVDDANCGACAKVCPTGTACNSGVCDCLKAAESYCDGGCVDIFTSQQHCGGCDHDCLGGECVSGFCQLTKLAENQDEPYGLAIDATYLYWSSSGVTDSIFRQKLEAGSTAELVANNQKRPREVAAANGGPFFGVVWANNGLADIGAGIQGSTDMATTAPLATSTKDGLHALAVFGTKVFWLNRDEGELWSADLTATGDPSMNGTKLAALLGTPWDVVADKSHVYFTTYSTGEVKRVPAGGGAQSVLAKGLGNPTGIALDTNYVYYAEENKGTISRVIKDGSADPVVLATGQANPANLVVDDKFVYFTNYGMSDTDGSVAKIPRSGGEVVVLAAAQNKPLQIVVDDTFVYWTTFGGKTIMKTPK